MIIIKLFIPGGEKYARKPHFKPMTGVPTTVFHSQAKQFKTVKQAHAWLARRGFMRRTTKQVFASGYTSIGIKNFPELFTGFELILFDNAAA